MDWRECTDSKSNATARFVNVHVSCSCEFHCEFMNSITTPDRMSVCINQPSINKLFLRKLLQKRKKTFWCVLCPTRYYRFPFTVDINLEGSVFVFLSKDLCRSNVLNQSVLIHNQSAILKDLNLRKILILKEFLLRTKKKTGSFFFFMVFVQKMFFCYAFEWRLWREISWWSKETLNLVHLFARFVAFFVTTNTNQLSRILNSETKCHGYLFQQVWKTVDCFEVLVQQNRTKRRSEKPKTQSLLIEEKGKLLLMAEIEDLNYKWCCEDWKCNSKGGVWEKRSFFAKIFQVRCRTISLFAGRNLVELLSLFDFFL